MSRDIELGHYPDAAVAGVGDDLAHLVLGVVAAIGPQLVKLREDLALDPEALVLGKVPVQDVELDRRHPVQRSLQRRQRQKHPPGVQQQPTPGKPGRILDCQRRHAEAVSLCLDQLQEGLDAPERADRRQDAQKSGMLGDLQRV